MQPQGPVLHGVVRGLLPAIPPTFARSWMITPCDHFRGEPWPESESSADRARRRQLIDGIRTSCAGTDRELADLLARHRDDATIMRLLSGFERDIENDRVP